MPESPKVTFLLKKKLDANKEPYFVGRPRLPVDITLDRFVFLVFPFKGDPKEGEVDGAEVVLELAHEDMTFKGASRTLLPVVKKIKDSELKEKITEWLDSINDEDYKFRNSSGEDLQEKLEEALKRAEMAENRAKILEEEIESLREEVAVLQMPTPDNGGVHL
jgi:hypothetical protein